MHQNVWTLSLSWCSSRVLKLYSTFTEYRVFHRDRWKVLASFAVFCPKMTEKSWSKVGFFKMEKLFIILSILTSFASSVAVIRKSPQNCRRTFYENSISCVLKWKCFLVDQLKNDKYFLLLKKDFSKTCLEADFKNYVWYKFDILQKKFLNCFVHLKVNRWCFTKIFESQVYMGKLGFRQVYQENNSAST